jgi:hypothetical protein
MHYFGHTALLVEYRCAVQRDMLSAMFVQIKFGMWSGRAGFIVLATPMPTCIILDCIIIVRERCA